MVKIPQPQLHSINSVTNMFFEHSSRIKNMSYLFSNLLSMSFLPDWIVRKFEKRYMFILGTSREMVSTKTKCTPSVTTIKIDGFCHIIIQKKKLK